MSESQSTTTPRLSEASSVDSPRDLPEPIAPAQAKGNNARMPGIKPPFHANTFSGSLDPLAYVSEDMYRKTPESEALASSDDEQEQPTSYFPPGLKNPKLESVSTMSSRRPSYAAEFSNRNRGFNPQNGHEPPLTESNPSSPLADLPGWPASKGPQERKTSINLTWSAGSIWNQGSSRKNPSKGLVGSILTPTGPGSLYSNADTIQSPTSLLPGSSSDLAIPIPPNPQPRNYRSMSFSVGQRELEEQARPRLSPPAHHTISRLSGLQHRPSRPSLLSEERFANGSPLRSVFEAPDHIEEKLEESPVEGFPSVQQGYASHSRQYDSMRFRNRTASAASSSARTITAATNNKGIDPNNPERSEEFENALADDDEVDALATTGFFAHNRGFDTSNLGRRFSEAPHSSNFPENQRLELLKKQHWQSVGIPFGGGEEDLGSQSRRHSFAGPLTKGPGDDYSINQTARTLETYHEVSPTQPEGKPIGPG
ncbi:hypothetical protein ABW19_dt0207200 [Dactylella cylindrospora]|nr:hypothetical protein ABW19_dt0207200 [Dactylella cylindrospora]